MSYVDEILAMKKPPKKKPLEPPKPNAAVIPFPQESALVVAKAERTRAAEVDRAFEEAERRERERIARAERLVASPEYAAAAERFNREYHRVDDTPHHFGNPGGWA
jgi:hypothetical protein